MTSHAPEILEIFPCQESAYRALRHGVLLTQRACAESRITILIYM